MTTGIFVFQAGIFLSFLVGGYRFRYLLALLWLGWTTFAVFLNWLFFIQLATIVISWYVAGTTRDVPLRWWWSGWPTWARKAERLKTEAKWYTSKDYGSVEFRCSSCFGSRCNHASLRRLGRWYRSEPTDPESQEYLTQRGQFMDELNSVIRAGMQTDPNHRWLPPLRSALEYMKSGADLEFASKDYLRYLWVKKNASKIHLDKVRRLTLEDLLTVGFLLVGVYTSVYFFVSLQGGIRDGEEFALMVLLVVTAFPYLIRVLIGLYWEKVRGIRMSHFFTPEGGLIHFALDWLAELFASDEAA